jgi:hypothetical protein
MPTLPTITKRQDYILQLLYDYRFLNRTQIQAFLGHKDKRATNDMLKALRDTRYIEGTYSTKFGENTHPAIYYASLGAIHYFKTARYAQASVINRLYRDNTRSQDFINRCMLVADIELELQRAKTDLLRYELATPSMYANPESGAHFLEASTLTPDALIVEDSSGTYTAYMLEVLTRGMPAHRLHGKINACLDLYYSGDWEANTDLDFPEILLVSSSTSQLRDARRYLQFRLAQENDAEDFKISFMTVSRLKAIGICEYLEQRKTL